MAKRKCPHKKVTRGKEMHIPVGVSYRHDDPDPIVEVRICDDCKAWLSVGRAWSRKPEVQVEIRAAEVGQHAEVWRRFMDYDSLVDDDLVRIGAHTWVLSLGSLSPDAGHTCLDPAPRWTPGEAIDYWAGWLGREIAEHDELQADADVLPPVSRGHENEGRCEGCREPIRDGEDVLRYDDDVVTHVVCPHDLAEAKATQDALAAAHEQRIAEQTRHDVAESVAGHADLDDHLDGCTTDVCVTGCVTDPAAKFGEQARQVTVSVTLPGRVPYAEDQMELPVVSEANSETRELLSRKMSCGACHQELRAAALAWSRDHRMWMCEPCREGRREERLDAMYPATTADVAADALRAGPMRGATPDEIDRAVDEPLPEDERAEVYRILSDVPSDEPETVGGGS